MVFQERPKSHRPFWEILIALSLALVAHHSVVDGSFFQDDTSILNASLIHSQSWSNLRERPLLYLSMQANHSLGGQHPVGYHIFNLAGHLLAVAGLYLLVLLLLWRSHILLRQAGRPLQDLAPGWGATASFLPFYSAVIFAVHPLITEPVAYVMARANGWGGALMIWAWALGLKSLMPVWPGGRGPSSAARVLLAISALLLWALSFGFKETHIILLAIFPLSLFLSTPASVRGLAPERLARGSVRESGTQPPWRRWGILLGFGLPALAMAVLLLWVSWPLLARLPEIFPLDPLVGLASQAPVLLWNWFRLIFPDPVSLEYDHLFRQPDDPFSWTAILIHLGLLVLAWRAGARRPLVRVATMMAYFTLALTNGILLRYDLWSDRNGYLACAAGSMILAGFFQEAVLRLGWMGPLARPRFAGKGMAAVGVFLLWVAILTILSHQRDRLYSDQFHFWEDAVAKAPKHPRAHLQLGFLYQAEGKKRKARERFNRTVELCLDEDYFGHAHRAIWYSMAKSGLASLELDRKDLWAAQELFSDAFEMYPSPENLRNLLDTCLKAEDPDSVEEYLEEAKAEGRPAILTAQEEKDFLDRSKKLRQELDEYKKKETAGRS